MAEFTVMIECKVAAKSQPEAEMIAVEQLSVIVRKQYAPLLTQIEIAYTDGEDDGQRVWYR